MQYFFILIADNNDIYSNRIFRMHQKYFLNAQLPTIFHHILLALTKLPFCFTTIDDSYNYILKIAVNIVN